MRLEIGGNGEAKKERKEIFRRFDFRVFSAQINLHFIPS